MNGLTVDFPSAEPHPSPNFGVRRGGLVPDMLVLHYTGMDSADSALQWLCTEESQVSAHYLVYEDGRIVQMVEEDKRAWHAGQSHWRGQTDLNSLSIGIEIANRGHEAGSPDFPMAQIDAVVHLCQNCAERWAIVPERIVAHSDIAPQRKADPGEKFPWRSLFENGVGHFVEPSCAGGGRFFQPGDAGQPIEALQAMLLLYGYGLEINGKYDEMTAAVVTAFQRHFRPSRVDGIADAATIETLHRLLKTLPKRSEIT
ncbi:MAG: N-acetylmuramoyl-L-alanine amidase [Alphaproteobacteria bacterium]|nr:N-acetylmuramoyl-L-alanine amidase [Alphaproteobacteria bacterium]